MALRDVESRPSLTARHSDEAMFFEPFDGRTLIPENVLRPSKGRHIGVRPSKGSPSRRVAGRVTTAATGKSHCGIVSRRDNGGEASTGKRKAGGQIRRAEAVSIWKAQPSLGMAGLSLSISSVALNQTQDLNQTSTK